MPTDDFQNQPTESASPKALSRVSLGVARQLLSTAANTSLSQLRGQWRVPSVEVIAAAFPELEVEEFIAKGGMGLVYRAYEPQQQRTVAIKLLPEELTDEPSYVERFKREFRVLQQLDHPNIVRVYNSGQIGQMLYYTMEFVEGCTLSEMMREGAEEQKRSPGNKGPLLPFESFLAYGRQITAAVQAAHEQGIVHRDLKPANILVGPSGVVKVADFGLARKAELSEQTTAITRPQELLGTANYLAPELKKGGEASFRSDIFALGILLHEMLAGEFIQGAYEPLSRKVGVHPRVDSVIRKAIHESTEKRYSSAGELHGALNTLRLRHAVWRPWVRVLWVSTAAASILSAATLAWHTVFPSVTPARGLLYIPFDLPPGSQALAKHSKLFETRPKFISADIVAESLHYTDSAGQTLAVKGGAAHLHSGSDDILRLTLPPALPSELWLSMLAQQTSGTNARFLNLVLRTEDDVSLPPDPDTLADEILAVGMPSGADTQTWQIWDRVTTNPLRRIAASPVPTTTPAFLVVKMEANIGQAGEERFTLWVNPRLGSPPPAEEGYSFQSAFSDLTDWNTLKYLRLGSGESRNGSPGSSVIIDEIRLGQTFGDVAPLGPKAP